MNSFVWLFFCFRREDKTFIWHTVQANTIKSVIAFHKQAYSDHTPLIVVKIPLYISKLLLEYLETLCLNYDAVLEDIRACKANFPNSVIGKPLMLNEMAYFVFSSKEGRFVPMHYGNANQADGLCANLDFLAYFNKFLSCDSRSSFNDIFG